MRTQHSQNRPGFENVYLHVIALQPPTPSSSLSLSHPAKNSGVDQFGIYFVHEQGVHCRGPLTWNPKLIDT